MMETERLYYSDSYLQEFDATVIAVTDNGALLLDRSAFYPTSGGQEHDLGWINDLPVTGVEETDAGVLHIAEGSLPQGASVKGRIDWKRRFDLMQQHTGQHLLSAVAHSLHGWETVSVHMSTNTATVEFATGTASEDQLLRLEEEANLAIVRNLPVTTEIADAATVGELRKATNRQGPIRVVEIEGLDRSACGGTHVRRTGEIGCLLLGKPEKIRGNVRVEFACGLRAVRVAASSRQLLASAAAVLNAHPGELPALVERQREDLLRLAKQNAVLRKDLALWQGREAAKRFAGSNPPQVALRWTEESPDDAARAFAAGFCEVYPGILLTLCAGNGAFLLASGALSSENAQAWFTENLKPLGAKGGGGAQQVSGRLSDPSIAPQLPARLGLSVLTLDGQS